MSSAARVFTPVAIIGGGPAGLTAARILQLHHVPCTVYENESAPTARNQGGSLDLHAENGLWALQQCGLIEQFNKVSRPEGDCMRIMNKSGAVLYSEQPPPPVADGEQAALRGRPEVDRLVLRNLLLDSLEPGTVQWGHALSSLQPLPPSVDGVCEWELQFKSGATARAALVIGADGAWSRVRPVLSSAVPRYTGVTFLDCTISHVAARHPHLAALVGPGTAFILDDERAIIAQMNGNDTLRSYACLKVSEGWTESDEADGGAFLSSASQQAIDAFIRRYFSDWHEAALDLMRHADMQSVAVRRIYALPFDHQFTHSQQSQLITALGDAAHVMGPNGDGVNLAMLDAAQLALALSALLSPEADCATAASPQQLSEQLAAAIAESERSMFERTKAQADDPVKFEFFLAENAAEKFVELFQQLMQAGQSDEAAQVAHNPAIPG